MNGLFASESNRHDDPLDPIGLYVCSTRAFILRACMQIEISLKDGQQGTFSTTCQQIGSTTLGTLIRDVCQHHGFSHTKDLSSHYFGMTIAAIQVDKSGSRLQWLWLMTGVDLSKTPAARSFGGSGKGVGSGHSALTNIAQCGQCCC